MDTIKILIEHGADVNVKSALAQNPRDLAIINGCKNNIFVISNDII